jgi:hypothetical protein
MAIVRRQQLRGDNIPTVADYAHWNEDAEQIWYLENKYDMEHWDEPIDYSPDEPMFFDDAEDISEDECEQLFGHSRNTSGYNDEDGQYIVTRCDDCGKDFD